MTARSKQQKSTVRASVKKRGRAAYNIWSVWSPKTQRRWVLKSDLCEEHWLLLEADPDIASFELGPGLAGDNPSADSELSKIDAVVRLQSGRVEWRSVKYRTEVRPDDPPTGSVEDTVDATFARCVITDEQLSKHSLLIENFRRVVSVQARTADFPPADEQNRVAALLRSQGRVALGDLVEGLDSPNTALVLSGAFALLTSGFARSDLDVARLSTRTQLWLRG